MTRREVVALAALTGAALTLALLPWLVGVDARVYRWVQFRRGCGMHVTAERIDLAVRAVLGALLVAGALAGRGRRTLHALGRGTVVIATGAALGEVLKTALDRPRPRTVPGLLAGNSFPSGHVMNTTTFAVVACLLARDSTLPRWARRLAYVLAAACVAAQATARVLAGSHWASDVTASVLLGIAWTLGAGLVRRGGRRAPAVATAAAAAVFLLCYQLPQWRIALPSALGGDQPWLAALDLGLAARATLPGPSRARLVDDPFGTAWRLEDGVAIMASGDQNDTGLLRMTLRATCDGVAYRALCTSAVASVNGWQSPPFTVSCQWREYQLAPPPGVLRRGDNRILLDARSATATPCGSGRGCADLELLLPGAAGGHAARAEIERRAPAEVLRLLASPSGTLAPVYTVGDETRPVVVESGRPG